MFHVEQCPKTGHRPTKLIATSKGRAEPTARPPGGTEGACLGLAVGGARLIFAMQFCGGTPSAEANQ